MKHLARSLGNIYSRLLNLYPNRFRDEFADEMHTVFRNSIVETAEEGIFATFIVCAREFMSMPFNILKEFWHEYQGKELNIPEFPFLPCKPGSWGDSVWAGLPHLLIAIFMAITSAFSNTRMVTISGGIFIFLLLVGLLITIYYTWRNRWPAWSASWYGYVGLIILLYSFLPYQDWVDTAQHIFMGIHFFLLLLTLAVLLYWLSRRDPIQGLLVAMPVIILYWLPVTEFIPNPIREWLTFWLFLLIGLTATAITHLNDIKKAMWFVLGASLLTGFPIAYTRTYWNNVPLAHATHPTLGIMIEQFSVPWLTSAALVLAPILAWGIWYVGKRYGKNGHISAALLILGMIVNFFGHFSNWWLRGNQSYFNALHISTIYRPNFTLSLPLVIGGTALLLVGAVIFFIVAWKQNKLLSVPIALALLALPLVAMFAVYFGNYIPIPGSSIQFAKLTDISRYLIQFAGTLWLLMSGWTVTHLYSPQIREGTA